MPQSLAYGTLHFICYMSLFALIGCERAVINAPPQRIVFAVSPNDPKELTANTTHSESVAISIIGNIGDQEINPKTIAWIKKDYQNSKRNFAMSIGTLTPSSCWIVYICANFELELSAKPEQLKTAQQNPMKQHLAPGAYGIRIVHDDMNGLQIMEIMNTEGLVPLQNVNSSVEQI